MSLVTIDNVALVLCIGAVLARLFGRPSVSTVLASWSLFASSAATFAARLRSDQDRA